MPDAVIPPRLSRTAALVHALGLLAAGILVATLCFSSKPTHEAFVIAGVASSAACVFIFWSLVLAIRAFTSGEKSRWPIAVLLLVLLEIGLPSLALWTEVMTYQLNPLLNDAIWLGLPVFGPFFAFGSLIAAPLALWRARKSETSESAADVKGWRSKKWKVWLAWYAGALTLLGVFLLPAPLYLLGAVGGLFQEPARTPLNWGHYIGRNSPDFIRDNVGALLDIANTSITRRMQRTIDERGLVSKQRLIAELSNAGTYTTAWRGLLNSYADAVPEVASGILRGEIFVSAGMRSNVAHWTGWKGTAEQITLLLRGPLAAVFKNDRGFLIQNMWRRDDVDSAVLLLGDLAVAGELNNFELGECFHLFAMRLKPQDQTKIWAHFLNTNGATHDIAALGSRECVMRGNFEPSLMYLRHSRLTTRQIALSGLVGLGGGLQPDQFRDAKNVEQLKLTRRLFELLDDSDALTKVSAMIVLGDIFIGDDGASLRYKIFSGLPPPGSTSPPVVGAEEKAEIEKVKSAVAKWLKENAPEPVK